MKLQDVPIVEETNTDVILDRPGGGQRTKRTEDVAHRFLDFGPDYRGYNQHVRFRAEEFECSDHQSQGFHPDCEACRAIAEFPIEALTRKDGAYQIEVEL